MKKIRKVKSVFLFFVFLVAGVMTYRYLMPSIVIFNNSASPLYVSNMQKKGNTDEPSIDEVEQLKKIKVIQPGVK